MKIYFREIHENDTHLDFTEADGWVAEAIARVDERFEEGADSFGRPATPGPRSIQAEVDFRKVDAVVVLNGNVRTAVRLVCSRCANYFSFPVDTHFTSLFCQDPSMSGVAHLAQGKGQNAAPVVMGRNRGHARHAHDEDLGTSSDIDITYVAEDHVDLGGVLTEQLMLQLPFQPLCREDCKGICANCGADLNTGRCPCAKLTKNNPFSALKGFKV